MAYWWVNHKQTYRVEIEEGYIWSPQKKSDGTSNPSYLNLTRVSPGDVIFSYAKGQISAIGLVIDRYIESKRPLEFGKIGDRWSDNGWLVPVRWVKLNSPLIPKNKIAQIAPLLPSKNSPIRLDGNGNQGIYLASVSQDLGTLLSGLLQEKNSILMPVISDLETELDADIHQKSIENQQLPPTFKEQLIKARIGQGKFRMEVEKIESRCRLTGVSDRRFLIASHIKPWKDSTDVEKLDGNNGLLLSPHIDKLFDKGYITFGLDGRLVVEDSKIKQIVRDWHIETQNPYPTKFTKAQRIYLEYHHAKIYEPRRGLLRGNHRQLE